ncbi:ribokinase [Pseudolysinimonas sp.]|uniref:ribokinase n=1 Tax=Pseudolysinimonas sp. TaxID=2680009 RepID=UPI003F7DCF10
MSRIAVVGSANLDLVVRQPRLPRPGETMFGSSFATVPGGKGLNQAVAAARAGAEVAFVGAVGGDPFGAELRAQLRADGIDVAALRTLAEPTGTAHISVLDGGENSIVVVPGANGADLALDAADRAAIDAACFVVAQFERPLPLIRAAFERARAGGATTVLTPAPVLEAGDLLELVDVLVPNAAEACELAGVDDAVAAARELSRRASTVVMTRGSAGALIARDGEIVTEIAARAVDAVDTTAAGDTFVGVLVARRAAGDELERAAHAASVAASIAVTRPGASSSMPTWAEVQPLL